MQTKIKTTVVTPTHTTFKLVVDGHDSPERIMANAAFKAFVDRTLARSAPGNTFELDTMEAHVPGGPKIDLPPQKSTAAAPTATNKNPPQGGGTTEPRSKE